MENVLPGLVSQTEQPTTGFWERCKLPSEVQGRASAANAFLAYLGHRTLLVERKMYLLSSGHA